MKTYVDWSDYLFGTWVEMQVPMPDGTIKRVSVTQKWLDQQEAAGKIEKVQSEVGKRIKVHVLDLASDMQSVRDDLLSDDWSSIEEKLSKDPYRVEWWVVGEQISAVEYEKVKDPNTGDVYASLHFVNGKVHGRFTTKEAWVRAREMMRR